MTKWEKILGGYATGTLTAAERASLMQAALSDQALFDVLMDEEALRETLADPATRAALLRALEPIAKTQAWWRNLWPWTGLGAVAAAVALVAILRPIDAPQPVRMAQNRSVAIATEPVPTIIETPKLLRLDEAQSAGKAGGGAQTAPPQMALAPPTAAPSGANSPAARRTPAGRDATAARRTPAGADARQAAPAPSPVTVTAPVATQAQDVTVREESRLARGGTGMIEVEVWLIDFNPLILEALKKAGFEPSLAAPRVAKIRLGRIRADRLAELEKLTCVLSVRAAPAP